MSRNMYDLTHQIHMTGKVGRLQTLGVIPVIAGDSLQMDIEGIFRFSPMRKEVVMDAQVELFAFYQPYRHIYGQNWIDFIEEGHDEGVTMATDSFSNGEPATYLGLPVGPASLPKWLNETYFNIWNYYFKYPDAADQVASELTGDDRAFGLEIARLKHPATSPRLLTGTSRRDLDASDFTLNIPVSGTANLDVRDLARVRGEARSEIERNWFTSRYNEIIKSQFGPSVNYDTEERPELIARQKMMMSGTDVDGTDDASLGSFVGKTVSRAGMNVNRKYFDEHGSVWIMAAVRFPFVHAQERHRLTQVPQPSYKEISGDPEIWANEEPEPYNPGSYIANVGGSWTNYYEPYGQWYRYHPSRVAPEFRTIPGYPFTNTAFNTISNTFYHDLEEYENIFATKQLGHWQMHLQNKCYKLTRIPDVRSSIYAGV